MFKWIQRPYRLLPPLLFTVTLLLGLFFLLLAEWAGYRAALQREEEHLENLLEDLEYRFSPFFQLVSTCADLTEDLPPSVEVHEEILENLFVSSLSELVYGMGIWYEPEAFQSGRTLFGPYIRLDDPRGSDYSLTYEWNTPAYDYHSTYWYRLIFDSEGEDLVITAPYFDSDYTYISIGKPFFRKGEKAGVITVDVIFPLLEEHFSAYDFERYRSLSLKTREGELLYTLQAEADSRISENNKRQKSQEVILQQANEESHFRISGVLKKESVYRELLTRHGYRYILFFALWLGALLITLIHSHVIRQNSRSVRLNDENLSLKEEIKRRVEAENQLQFVAFHDSVTTLENLNAFFEIEKPKPEGEDRFLIQISLNNIRELSTFLERKLIDRLLRDFADKLVKSCPPSSQQYRGSGFIFYIVNEGEGSSLALAEHILQEFSKTIPLHNRSIRFRFRIGIAPFREARDLEHLINISQSALSESGSLELNRIVRYSSEVEYRKSYLIALDAEMGRDYFIDELRVVYQPIIRVEDRRIAGVEALVRWDSSHFSSTISPVEFIPLAEENGYIIELGWYVIREVLGLLAGRLKDSGWFVTVNVSPLQFIESDFAEKLDELTSSFAVDKKSLKIEITETSTSSGVPFFWQTIEDLIQRDFRLVIDDFGTGESSFSRLYAYPFDALKIDRSLIRDILDNPRNQRIFRSILNLGEVMDNNVVAEGIEAEEEHELLKSFGLKYAQGFLYSRPVAIEELLD